MNEHTPEPWIANQYLAIETEQRYPRVNIAETLTTPEYATQAANARRIVAAVNACAGIPIDDLEQTKWADEMTDYRMVLRHCAIIYDEASSGRISKPNTLPSEVISIMHELEGERIDEAVKEARDEQDTELTALRAQRDELAECLRETASRFHILYCIPITGRGFAECMVERCAANRSALTKLTEEVRA